MEELEKSLFSPTEDKNESPLFAEKAVNTGQGNSGEEDPRKDDSADISEALELLASARKEMSKRIVGQDEMIDGILAALVAGGHILLEGVPGLAKTRAVKTLAEITGFEFKRIQFTPDLLPADLTGTMIWEQATSSFSVRRGPVFANVILADEINRAPAKVQSALLEAMEEKQVTIGEKSYPLPDPFFVLATQNPIEHEGTYALPEAELDRFLMKLLVRYPSQEDELKILSFAPPFNSGASGVAAVKPEPELKMVLGPSALAVLRRAADSIFMDEQIKRYIVSVAAASRPPVLNSAQGTGAAQYGAASGAKYTRPKEGLYRYITFGASPRAVLALYRCARVRALLEGRAFVSPEDVKAAAYPVMRHRLVLSYEAEADGLEPDTVISGILALVPAP